MTDKKKVVRKSAKISKPLRDAFGRFLAKQKRDSKGRFVPREVKPPPVRKAKLAPINRPVSIKEFPHKKTVAATLKAISEQPESFNAMLKKGDRWGFVIQDTNSIRTFPNIQILVAYLGKYDGNGMPYFDNKRKSPKLLRKYHRDLGTLKLVRWPKGAKESEYRENRKVKGKRVKMEKAKRAAEKRRKK